MKEETKEMPVRKFRVLMGTHVQNGKAYLKGKIVKSTSDLSKLFVGKFAEVGKRDDEADEEVATPAKTASGKPARIT